MKYRDVDVAVIGAGSAGLVAFRKAKTWTENLVLIEGGPHGTTCARVGCMPSKLLIAASEAAHAVEQAHHFGVRPQGIEINGAAVMDRVRRERDRFVGFVVDGVDSIPESQRISGYAHFLDDHRLQVDAHTIVNAKRVVIATGSSPVFPATWKELGDRLIINDDIFDWTDLPASVAVFGPGVIGLELGQALSRLGVDVSLFGRGGQFGPLTDPKVMATARDTLGDEFYIDDDVDVRRMERVEDGVAIDFVGKDGTINSMVVEYVVAATGRNPNVSALGLENTSLPLDERGIPLFDDETMQIGHSHVFIAGDVNNDRPLLHEAADEGQIAGDNAGRFPNIEPGFRRSGLAVVFSDPQIAMVGDTYASIAKENVVIGEVSFEDQGRSRVMLKNQGLLRVYADAASGRFLGAELFGPRAEHLAHLLAWAHQSELTIDTMLQMPFYHPVIEEGLRTALRDVSAQLRARVQKAA